MRKLALLILPTILFVLLLPQAQADIIFKEVNETSGVLLNESLNVELRNATVKIDTRWNGSSPHLTGSFQVYSNEKETKNALVYLKAKGMECYDGDCDPKEVVTGYGTYFKIEGGSSKSSQIYQIGQDKYAGVNFTLKPQQTTTIEVHQNIDLPFKYDLDSLSTYSQADYEKITILGNVSAQFNQHYPVERVEDNKQIWEYSNLDPEDENLHDSLLIKSKEEQEPEDSSPYLYFFVLISLFIVAIGLSLLVYQKYNPKSE